MKKHQREYGIDIIKIVALMLVFFIHYFDESGWRTDSSLDSLTRFLFHFFNQINLICCPIFFMCTGYLFESVSLIEGLKKAIYVWYVWILYAGALLLKNVFEGQFYSFIYIVKSVVSINTIIGREWYVRSCIPLLIFAPFINNAWKNLQKKDKQVIIVLLTIMIPISNAICKIIEMPVLLTDIVTPFWPFMYYLIGKYIKEFKPLINKNKACIGGLLYLMGLSLFFSTIMKDGVNEKIWSYYIPNVTITSILVFCLLYNLPVNNKYGKAIACVANTSLDTYLVARIIEQYLYGYFSKTKEFIVKNIPKLCLVICICIFIGVIRTQLSKSLNKNKRVILIRIVFVIIIIISISFSRSEYVFASKNAGKINQLKLGADAKKIKEGLVNDTDNNTCMVYGPYQTLYKSQWTLEIHYDNENKDAYCEVVQNENVILQEKLSVGKDVRTIMSFNVEDENSVYQYRIITDNQTIFYKMILSPR